MEYQLTVKPRGSCCGILTVYAEDGFPCDFQIRKFTPFDANARTYYVDSGGSRYNSVKAFAQAKIKEIS